MGTLIRLQLNLPGSLGAIHFTAKIKRVREWRKNKSYEIGAHIVQIRDSEKRALKQLIRKLQEQTKKTEIN